MFGVKYSVSFKTSFAYITIIEILFKRIFCIITYLFDRDTERESD